MDKFKLGSSVYIHNQILSDSLNEYGHLSSFVTRETADCNVPLAQAKWLGVTELGSLAAILAILWPSDMAPDGPRSARLCGLRCRDVSVICGLDEGRVRSQPAGRTGLVGTVLERLSDG